MTDLVNYLVIGLGAGSAYALLALGVALIYRGSGVINFAQGAMGLVGAATYYELRSSSGAAVAIAGALVVGAAFGAVVQVVVMRQMRRASPIARMIATLALASSIQAAALIKYGPDPLPVVGFLPRGALQVGGVAIVYNRLALLAIACLVTLVLWFMFARSRWALATTGAAENEQVVAAAGWSPNLLALINWAIGGLLAALAGVLLVPLTNLSPDSLYLTVLPALAACLAGGWSFPWILASALAVGILESEATRYISAPGWGTAVPFLFILAVLVLRGRALPVRGHDADRLPRLGSGHINWGLVAIAAAVTAASIAQFQPQWTDSVTNTAVYGLIGLSLVVLVGYCGQVSLAQYALAGVAALATGQLASRGVPFLAALILGVAITVPVGMLVALPAVRTRGVSLAVVTLAFGSVITSVVLANSAYTGGLLNGLQIPDPKFLGISFESIAHAKNFAYLCLVLLILAGLALANLRRSRSGLSMIAVRDNERAAASVGIDVAATKLHAFAVSTVFAATAGGLMALRSERVSFDAFTPIASINALLVTVIGGIGLIGGGILGAANAVGGAAYYVILQFFSVSEWFVFATAVLVIPVVVLRPDGLAMDFLHIAAWVRARREGISLRSQQMMSERLHGSAARLSADGPAMHPSAARPPDQVAPVEGKRLALRDVIVRFGGVVALDRFAIEVDPGEVVGLIGPNGAGKTTLIDATTGFVRMDGGTILLGEERLDGLRAHARARRGLSRSFQSLELFEDLTVRENVLLGDGAVPGRARRVLDLFKPTRHRLTERAMIAVHEFELENALDRYPHELPYSRRRLVAIARAVAAGPSVLLLDEPAAGLDARSTRELGELLRRVSRRWHLGILLIEHDVAMVLSCCDRVVAMDFGRRIASGTPDEIRTNPAVVEAYLGAPVADEADQQAAIPAAIDTREATRQ